MCINVESFFNQQIETDLNAQLINSNDDYLDKSREYIVNICSIPLELFVSYIYQNFQKEPVLSPDIYQFSSFTDATSQFCKVMIPYVGSWLSWEEIGILLQDDGTPRSKSANTKYGENHSKLATILGLAFTINKHYYLSACGSIFPYLQPNLQERFIHRCILRSKLIIRLLLEEKDSKPVFVEPVLYDIAKSTYSRRKPNIETIVKTLNQSTEYDFRSFISNLIF